ncbi:phage tail tape measure protein [Stutzerimonas stutzeri]|uniref:phage tail tape measure protein n=1 Tax=Stutzerimonas stutzeri TaxID=316 RepID=UPI0008393E67|nr:phage tail tape measure protein [Stutzerimonas stutzeri]MDH1556832.1 phage tail tape measure protein [Stutzerimonas stutzeri]OCX57209.1 phage tail tape measure protein [Stutzerimonas stutzeri]
MSNKFDVDFSEALRQLAEFQAKTRGLGESLDKVQQSAKAPIGAAGKLMKEMHKHFSDLETALTRVGVDAEAAGAAVKRSRETAQGLFTKLAADNLTLTTRARAYNGELKELERLLKDTGAKSSFVKWAERTNNITAELSNQNRYLVKAIQAALTAEGQYNQRLKAKLATNQRILNADELRKLKTIELEHAIQNLDTAEGRALASAQVRMSATRKAISEDERRREKLNELERQYASLHGGMEQEIVLLQRQIAERRKQILGDDKARQSTSALTQVQAEQNAQLARQAASLKAKNQVMQEVANGLHRMTRAEAEAIAKAEALRAATKKSADALLDEARSAHGMSKAQLELNRARQVEIDRLERLKVQKDLISGAYGRELAQTRRQIAEQERYNRLLAMTTAELLGLTNAQRRLSLAQATGSQSAAMLRAGLAGLHTSIGMYTSATIVAASSTYAIAAGLRSAITVGSEFSATMSRADAIMSTSRPAWMSDNGSMAAMEVQVRALGQSTAYTASQVAEGLGELGMAGLSAGDAVLALRPALDLAMIGNISMGQSADIATNVMMTFGKTAGELTEVVDVMATAVTNSNTTIEQLANSLTYAGPAAQTAGISMRDTVAAIEAMANSGIKSSRSGTALRRLFVSLVNPTKKGAEMMEQYGISVLDAEGKTRGLVDIVTQLNKALSNVSGAERLGAIQDLVGVYATSPVAALVDQADNLVHLRNQLDNVAGAAERMREKIEDTLSKDWNQVVSAFQEVQLTAFDAYEMRMREGSMRLAQWLVQLTEPIETLADGSTISQLDMILQRAENLARVIGMLGAGFVALKVATVGSNLVGALASDMGKLGTVYDVLKAKAGSAAVGVRAFDAASLKAAASARLQYAANHPLAASLNVVGSTARGATAALGGLSVAVGALSKALGWVGLLWGIYEAGKAAFGSDARQDIIDQRGEVDNLKSSYEQLKEEMKKVSLEKEREALRGNVKADKLSIDQLRERNATIQATLNSKGAGLDQATRDSLQAMVEANTYQITQFEKHIDATNKKLSEMGSSALDAVRVQEDQITAAQKVVETYEQYLAAKADLDAKAASGTATVQDMDGLKKAEAAWRSALTAAASTNAKIAEVKENLVSLAEISSADAAKQDQEALAKQLEKDASATQKLATARGELLRVEREISELAAQDKAAIEAGTARPGQDTYNRLSDKRAEVSKQIAELEAEADTEAQTLADARRALEDYYRTDAENLDVLKQDLEDIMLMRVINNQLIAEGGQLGAEASVAESERLKRELELRQRIDSLQERINKPGTKPGTKPRKSETEAELERNLKQAQSSYDALRKQADPLSASLEEVNEKTKQLELLHKHGKITAEQKAKAIWQLRKAHYELAIEQNNNYQSLEKLRDSYLDSPFSETLDDMTELNRLLRENNVSLAEYKRIKESIKTRAIESATNGLPTANLQMGDASSTPFTDWMGTEIERAQGLSQFGKRKEDLFTGYENDVDRINREFEARQAALDAEFLQQAEHAERLKQLEQEKNASLLTAHQTFADQSMAVDAKRAQYAEQMSQMAMISMLGSAENILGMFASAGEDATAAQKAAFVAQKALAIAQILMYTHLAAAQAMTIPGDPMKVMGIPLASMITAQGYASAALVGGLAIAEMSGAKTGGSSYSGAYDDGGFIPYNSYGIVGEYGPEIVHGPANVTSREKSAKKMGSGQEFNITLAPNITVEAGGDSSGGSTKESEAKARELAETLKTSVVATMRNEMRPGGTLDTWIKQQRKA